MFSKNPKYDLIEKYNELVASNTMQFNQAQYDILDQLKHLTQKLLSLAYRANLIKLKGYYLWGDVGQGKTFMVDLFLESLPLEFHRYHFHELMNKVHKSGESIEKFGEEMAQKLLVLDEFYVDHIADAMILYQLFDSFWKNGGVVIFTSNRDPDELYKNGLNRERFLPFIPLLKKHNHIINVKTDVDYRKRNKNLEYFFNDSQKFNVIFEQHAAESLLIDFYDLCEQPMGTYDYQKLSNEYKICFIKNIPILDANKSEALKRFILFIDIWYNAHLKLVLHSEHKFEDIFKEEFDVYELKFPTKRMISRIVEMINPSYFLNIHK